MSESKLENLVELLCEALGKSDLPFPDLRTQPAELGRAMAEFLSRISPVPEIFLDNLEYCRDAGLGAFLDSLVGTLRGGGVWIATTRHPGFDFTRHIATGRLRCLRMRELSFSATDASAFLKANCAIGWKPAWLDQIQARTLGFPLALSLLSAVLQSAPDAEEVIRQFTGCDVALVSFLRSAWFETLDEDLQQFLRAIAWLDPIDADLCSVVIQRPNCAALLDRLVHENCFLQPLDRNSKNFSLHPLVRDFLQGEAVRDMPSNEIQCMLLRAVEWTCKRGCLADAVEYALAANSAETVSKLLNEIAPSWVGRKGELVRYIEWIARARKMDAPLTLECEYWHLWALLFARQYHAAYRQSEILWERSATDPSLDEDPGRRPAFLRRFEELRILVDIFSDRTGLASERASRWLEDAQAQNDISLATMACCVAINATVNFDFRTARQAIHIAQRGTISADSDYGTAWVAALSAQVDLYEGELLHCKQTLTASLGHALSALGNDSNVVSTTRLLLASCLLQMGKPGEAYRYLDEARAGMPTHGVSETTFCGVQAALDLWNGSEDGDITPAALRHYLNNYPPPMETVFECCLIRRLLQLNRLDEAYLTADVAGLDEASLQPDLRIFPSYVQELDAMTRLELMMARGRFRDAEQLATVLLRQAEAVHRNITAVELHITLAIITFNSDKLPHAQRHLQHAIRFAARRGILQPFLLHLDQLRTIVARFKMRDWSFANNDEAALFEKVRGGRREEQASESKNEDVDLSTGALTARELELMRLVDAGLSNQQIAERSGISLTTVKWHCKNIYTKLEVRNRSAATAKLRTLNLL
jgi:LuxR family maltose regulon positive regulatory protein